MVVQTLSTSLSQSHRSSQLFQHHNHQLEFSCMSWPACPPSSFLSPHSPPSLPSTSSPKPLVLPASVEAHLSRPPFHIILAHSTSSSASTPTTSFYLHQLRHLPPRPLRRVGNHLILFCSTLVLMYQRFSELSFPAFHLLQAALVLVCVCVCVCVYTWGETHRRSAVFIHVSACFLAFP